MSEWQPIETAPKDGTVILSDQGSCRWADSYGGSFWHLCDVNGYTPSCADWGEEVSRLNVGDEPTRWMPFPK